MGNASPPSHFFAAVHGVFFPPFHLSTVPLLTVRVYAPGNIGPGLDILGCAVTGVGDVVTAELFDGTGVRVDDTGHPDIPSDPERHASAIAANAVLRRAGATDVGIALRLEKNLPLSGGQGGSAASAVGGAMAANALLNYPLDYRDLLRCALVAEERVAGRHIDNLAPALFGGIILVRSIEPMHIEQLPVPDRMRLVVIR